MNALVYPRSGRAAVAPYARIKQHLKDELSRGRWPPGAPMPSDAELVAQFGVSRMTVTRALNELRAEGLIERVQGVGTFAAHLFRVSSHLAHPRPARGDHRARPPPPCRGACGAPGSRGRRPGAAAGPGGRRAGVPHADRALRGRRGAAVRRPLRQPGLRARLPEQRLHAGHADAVPAAGGAVVGGAVFDRGRAAHRQGSQAAGHRPRRALPGGACAAPSARTCRSPLARLVHPGTRYLLQGEFKP